MHLGFQRKPQLLFLLVALCFFLPGCSSQGRVLESWETDNPSFQIRVVAHAERFSGVVGGAYYVFSAKRRGANQWHEFMTFRHDDPVPIPRENTRFVAQNIAYTFIGWMFAVTVDGARTWSIWDAKSDLPKWRCCNYGLIGDVQLQTDGTGQMTLNPIQGRSGELPKLCTTDFGRHWTDSCGQH